MATKLNIFIFVLALVILVVFLFALPPDSDASRYENRAMGAPPEFTAEDFLSGKLSNNLEAYLSDSIAFRTAFLELSSKMEHSYGIRMRGPTMVDIDYGDMGDGLVGNPGREGAGGDGNAGGATGAGGGSGSQTPEGSGGSGDSGDAGGAGGAGSAGDSGGAGGLDDSGTTDGAGSAGDSGGSGGSGGEGASGAAGDSGGGGNPGETGTTGSPGAPGTDAPFTLPPSSGRRIKPGDSFGVDINYNPDAVFYSRFYVDGETVSQYASTLNSYREGLPGSVRVFCLLAPSLAEFLDERYTSGDGVQFRAIDNIYQRLSDGITPVDAYKNIAQRIDGEYLYFRTDHHWTALGAYYAYLAYAQAAGLTPITIDNYVEFAFPGYIGSLITGTPDSIVRDNPDTLYYYQIDNGTTFSQSLIVIPENVEDMGYRVFMDGDHDILDYTSSNKNGKMLIVIKDSFANALIPWVSPNYERIVVVDPRIYTGSVRALASGSMDIDLLVVNTSLTPSLPGFVEKLGNIW